MEKASGGSFARTTRKTAEDEDGDGDGEGGELRRDKGVKQFKISQKRERNLLAFAFNSFHIQPYG